MIQVVRFHICYEDVTPGGEKLKLKENKIQNQSEISLSIESEIFADCSIQIEAPVFVFAFMIRGTIHEKATHTPMGGAFGPSQHLLLGARYGFAGARKQLGRERLHGTGEPHPNFLITKLSIWTRV
jgi:hypothetical protein